MSTKDIINSIETIALAKGNFILKPYQGQAIGNSLRLLNNIEKATDLAQLKRDAAAVLTVLMTYWTRS